MSAWTGTRVPAKTGVPLRMSGDDVMIGFAIAFTLLSRDASSQGIERRRSAACSGSEHAGGEDSVLMRPHLRHSVGLTRRLSGGAAVVDAWHFAHCAVRSNRRLDIRVVRSGDIGNNLVQG